MSIEQLNLAFKTDIQKSSTKFVLVALADYANEAGEAYPTIETITFKTSLNRKTIISALKELALLGLITDTGMVRGKTGQVKVWKLKLKPTPERVPKTGRLDKAKKQPSKQSQKRNSTESGTVPLFPPKEPENGTVKEYQKRDTEPSSLLTTIEPPVKEIEKEKKETPDLPDWIDTDAWSEWMAHRKKLKASNSPRAINSLIKDLEIIKQSGFNPTDAIDIALKKGWKTVQLEYLQNLKGNNRPANDYSNTDYSAGTEGFITNG